MHGAWASRWTFIIAATGSAVGLGNMWKFPYVAGSNGGGAFVGYLSSMHSNDRSSRYDGGGDDRSTGRQSPINSMKDLIGEHHINEVGYLSVGWALLLGY